MSLRTVLKGTGVALVTPFKTNHEVDYDALEKVIDFVINNGVEYLITLGSTGEAATLSRTEKIEIIDFTFEKVKNRVPVIVGIGGNNTKELIDDLESYPLDEAIAVLSSSGMNNEDNFEAAIIFSRIAAINNEGQYKSIALDFLDLLFLRRYLTKAKLLKQPEFKILYKEQRWIDMNKRLN